MGTLNLKTNAGGSVIFEPQNTATDVTVFIPAANSTIAATGSGLNTGNFNVSGAMTARGGGTILESLDVSNINMSNNGFDSILNYNSGGSVTWAPTGPGYIGITNTSGGHNGEFGYPINIPNAGYWRFRTYARLTTTNGNIHGNTPTDNYRFTIGFRFYFDGGADTGEIKWDANALGNGTRTTHLSGITYMTAGNKQMKFNTNGYAGIKHVYILGLFLERVA